MLDHSRGPERLPWIDGLRGIAVLGVMAIHAGACNFGNRGVQLFFFASAFTLMVSLDRRQEPLLYFYVRRFFRIAPMFYLALAFYCVTRGALQSVLATISFLFALTPWTIWSAVPGGWSVGEEWLFYLLLPLASRHISTPWRSIALLIALAVGGNNIVRPVMTAFAPVETSTQFWRDSVGIWVHIPLFFTAFAAGMILFHVRKSSFYERIRQTAPPWRNEAVLIAALVFLGWRLAYKPENVVPIAVSFIPIGLALSLGAGRWLLPMPIRYIGKVSFSCYLLHFAVLTPTEHAVALLGMSENQAALARFVIVTVVTVAISTITYHLIEKRGIAIGEAIIGKLKARAVAAAVEAPQGS